jgi:hypothetical protein
VLAAPLAQLESYGMMILIGVLLTLPMIGAQMGLDFSVVSHVVGAVTNEAIAVILRVTGHTIVAEALPVPAHGLAARRRLQRKRGAPPR